MTTIFDTHWPYLAKTTQMLRIPPPPAQLHLVSRFAFMSYLPFYLR